MFHFLCSSGPGITDESTDRNKAARVRNQTRELEKNEKVWVAAILEQSNPALLQS